jgi:hypothetical protein
MKSNQKEFYMFKLDLVFVIFLITLFIIDIFFIADYAKLNNRSGLTGAVIFLVGDILVLLYYLGRIILPYLPPRTPRSKK